MPLLFLIRKFLRYVYRSNRVALRSLNRLPNILFLLLSLYLISAYLTACLVIEKKSTPWSIVEATRLFESHHPDLDKSYLPLPYQQNLPQEKSILATLYDPRLIPALWLHVIRDRLEKDRLGFDAKLSLPFRWESYLDLLPLVVSPALTASNIESCASFRRAFHIGMDTTAFCRENGEHKALLGFPGVKIIGPTDGGLNDRARAFVGANYLIHLDKVPERAVLLGVGPSKSDKRKAVVVPIKYIPSVYLRMDVISLVEEYLESCVDCSTITLTNELERLENIWEVSDTQINFKSGFELQRDSIRIEHGSLKERVHLDPTDFTLSYQDVQQYFNTRVHERNPWANDLDLKMALNAGALTKDNNSAKYFHEALLLSSSRGSHFDWRFFKKSTYSIYEHQAILHRLSRAWLRFSNLVGLDSWLAHGTLLGWYWNGFNMPWDQDLDVQMSMKSLFLLGRNHNQSVVVDYTDVSETTGVHLYFVDVSPHIFDRENGNGKNVIDARFIDMSSGMYVDITGLAITNDYWLTYNASRTRNSELLHKVFDTEYSNAIKSAREHPDYINDYLNSLNIIESETWEKGHLYNCKNFHFYNMLELSPLQKTTFEGEQAFVPANSERLLQREYIKGTFATEYGNWIFRPALGLWVHKKTCKNDYRGNDCRDAAVLLEESSTRSMRLTRKNRLDGVLLRDVRADPWMMERNELLQKFTP
ncbi:CIC11C00000005882 [Sungouiella intermedia]|uniref:CIC11C00000005882 n=1 Tax=Sungouiella intermedia TaxID=45354 RepID=A0A1L0BUZ5_9ASCO|nr:CIC11C00000005882 [[Candida] intermedia]